MCGEWCVICAVWCVCVCVWCVCVCVCGVHVRACVRAASIMKMFVGVELLLSKTIIENK